MQPILPQTSERIHPEYVTRSREAYVEYLRHVFAYEWVKGRLTSEDVVLEIGCGDGYGAALLAPTVRRMLAVDIDQRTVLAAMQKYTSIPANFAVYDGMHLPYGARVFDVVIAFQVIEHIHQAIVWLHDIRRVVKPGGVIFLTTPNACLRLHPGQRPWNLYHVREYTPRELAALLKPLFVHVDVCGIRGTAEIHALESVRVQRARRLSRLDPFRIRRFLPASAQNWCLNLLKKILRKGNMVASLHEALQTYRLADYRVSKDNLDTCLDVLAICHV